MEIGFMMEPILGTAARNASKHRRGGDADQVRASSTTKLTPSASLLAAIVPPILAM